MQGGGAGTWTQAAVLPKHLLREGGDTCCRGSPTPQVPADFVFHRLIPHQSVVPEPFQPQGFWPPSSVDSLPREQSKGTRRGAGCLWGARPPAILPPPWPGGASCCLSPSLYQHPRWGPRGEQKSSRPRCEGLGTGAGGRGRPTEGKALVWASREVRPWRPRTRQCRPRAGLYDPEDGV